MTTALIRRYQQLRCGYFRWRYQASFVSKISLSLAMASLTGLAAQMRFPLPFTPVPITGQTMAVLLSGVVLGRRYGAISQLLYVGMGAAGIPWFAGWGGGILHLAGPTGGYIVGFIIAAFFIGHFIDTYPKLRNFLPGLLLMLVANFLLIHGLGLFQLYLWLFLVKGTPAGIFKLLMMGTIPFIPGDIIKAVGAAALIKGITPKVAYSKLSKNFSSKQ